MLSSLARRVGTAIRISRLWDADDRVAVALSGGPDSVALLHLLVELAARSTWTIAGVIHVHHGLRGPDADLDTAFCRSLAAQLGLSIDVSFVDVAAARLTSGGSIEAAARALRYEAFEQAARRLGATVVTTGHTLDDQAETVMLRLLRGASLRGVSAIRPRRGRYARPLLGVRRRVLLQYLAARGVACREDASNADRAIPRNRLRHEVMPVVEQAWPAGAEALARFAALAEADERYLSALAGQERPRVIRIRPDGVELKKQAIAGLDPAIGRRVVRDAIEQAGGRPSAREIAAVLALAHDASGHGSCDLHGVVALADADVVSIVRQRPDVRGRPFHYDLDVPGVVEIDETGDTVRASLLADAVVPSLSEGWDAMAVLQQADVMLPLTVRTRRPGDRLTPLGAPGSRLLQDLFVDRRIARFRRDCVPVVVGGDQRILWVAGIAIAEQSRVRMPRAGMVILEFKKGTL